jgi:hypothetical protein
MASSDPIANLAKFLSENHPGDGLCMVCKNKKGKYFLVEKPGVKGAVRFLINGHFFYDYANMFNDEGPWDIIFKEEI